MRIAPLIGWDESAVRRPSRHGRTEREVSGGRTGGARNSVSLVQALDDAEPQDAARACALIYMYVEKYKGLKNFKTLWAPIALVFVNFFVVAFGATWGPLV